MKKILFLSCLLFGLHSFSQELSVVKTSSKETGEKLVSNATISISNEIIEFKIEGKNEVKDVVLIYQDKNKSIYELQSNKNVRYTYVNDDKNHLLLKEIKDVTRNKVDEFYYFLK